jgi:hypothetical protein
MAADILSQHYGAVELSEIEREAYMQNEGFKI